MAAKDGTLGLSSRSWEKASLGLFIAQDLHRNLAGGGRHQKRSCLFMAQTQAELLTLLFLSPPHLALDQMPSVLETTQVSKTQNVVCELCAVKRALDLKCRI